MTGSEFGLPLLFQKNHGILILNKFGNPRGIKIIQGVREGPLICALLTIRTTFGFGLNHPPILQFEHRYIIYLATALFTIDRMPLVWERFIIKMQLWQGVVPYSSIDICKAVCPYLFI